MARAAVGVEIHQKAVTVVALRQGRRGPMLAGFATVVLPPGAVTRTGVADPRALGAAVKEALREARADRANVCLSIASEHIDVRRLYMPPMPEAELRQAIQWELKQQVRFPVESEEEILFDFQVLQNENGRQELLVVSAPGKLVYDYLGALRAERIHPEIMDAFALSLPWAVPGEGGVGYVHVGPEFVHVLVVRDGVYQLSRKVPVAAGALLEELGADPDGGAGEPVLSEYAARAAREVVSVVTQTLEFHRVEVRGHDVAELVPRLVVSGAGNRIDRLARLIGAEVGLPAVAAQPLTGPGGRSFEPEEAPRYAVAAGLAQRGLAEL